MENIMENKYEEVIKLYKSLIENYQKAEELQDLLIEIKNKLILELEEKNELLETLNKVLEEEVMLFKTHPFIIGLLK